MNSRRAKIIGTVVVSHALTHTAELTFPATALLVTADFFGSGREYAEVGLAAFVASLLFGAAALPSGWLVDRIGPKRVLLISLFGTGLSLVALSLMPDFTLFTVALGFMGAFSGLYHPAGTTMITHGLEEHGKAMGAHGMGGNLGLALTPFVAASLAQATSWQYAYAALGCLPLLMGFLVLALRVNVTEGGGEDEPTSDPRNLDKSMLILPVVLIFAMNIFNGMTYRGLMTFLPSYFAEQVNLSWLPLKAVTVGGMMTTAILLLGVVGQMIGGSLADRYKKEKLYTGFFLCALPLLFMLSHLDNLPLVAATGGFALLYFASQPVGNAMLPRYAGLGAHGRLFGLFFFAGFGVGSIMSYIAGYVGERFELSIIFNMIGGTLAVAVILGFFLIRATRELS